VTTADDVEVARERLTNPDRPTPEELREAYEHGATVDQLSRMTAWANATIVNKLKAAGTTFRSPGETARRTAYGR